MKVNKKNIEKKISNIKDNIKTKKEKFKKKKTTHKILIILLSLGIIFVGAILFFAIYIITSAPDFETDKLYASEPSILYDKYGNQFAKLGAEDRVLVTYDDLPQVLIDAIVATEDARFFQHDGFDIARFMKASMGQLSGNSGAGGASTLTMQVVKNTYTSTESSGVKGIIRKFTDIYMSIFKIEKKYTKEEIMEFYVNSPWLGSSAWGVEQASKIYFGKSVRDLSLPEAALIAGIFNAPKTYSPFNNVENATARRDTVLELMYRHGYITEEQLNDAKAISVESLIVEKKSVSLNKYQSFSDAVVNEVEEDTGMNPYTTAMEIHTTLDPNVQDVLNALNNGELYTFVNDVVQVAIAVTDVNDGSVTAVDGGRNQTEERSYNRATQMKRHPGSTAKPIFDYGPLIEFNNASTGTYFFDEPMTYSNGTSVKNADGKYQGIETMRSALAASRNIPAIQAFQQLEKEQIANFAHSLGIDYGEELYESCAIGGFDGVSPLELAAAYSAFARGGYYIEPYTYTKITFKDNNDVIEQKPKREKVMSEETAYMVTSMLMTAQSNGVGGNFSISGTDVAAKTGTSTYDAQTLRQYGIPDSASMDNWNITYSPDYVISLWYGYDKLTTKEYYTNSNAAAGVRKRIMAAIGKKIYKTNSKFTKPSNVVEVEVEKETIPLQLPSQYTPADMRITELFKEGTEPTDVSIRYDQLPAPTGGSAKVDGKYIDLSWKDVTANAISNSYLEEYFSNNYGQFATQYYNRRLSYNNSNIGYLGYQVYLKEGGKYKPLGFTTKTSYSYNTHDEGGKYVFAVTSRYSIFSDNESESLIIEKSISGSSHRDDDDDDDDDSYTIGNAELVNDSISLSGNGSFDPISSKYIKITDTSGSNITSKVISDNKVSARITKGGSQVSSIDLDTPGTYKVSYSISGYSGTLNMTVTVE